MRVTVRITVRARVRVTVRGEGGRTVWGACREPDRKRVPCVSRNTIRMKVRALPNSFVIITTNEPIKCRYSLSSKYTSQP